MQGSPGLQKGLDSTGTFDDLDPMAVTMSFSSGPDLVFVDAMLNAYLPSGLMAPCRTVSLDWVFEADIMTNTGCVAQHKSLPQCEAWTWHFAIY